MGKLIDQLIAKLEIKFDRRNVPIVMPYGDYGGMWVAKSGFGAWWVYLGRPGKSEKDWLGDPFTGGGMCGSIRNQPWIEQHADVPWEDSLIEVDKCGVGRWVN